MKLRSSRRQEMPQESTLEYNIENWQEATKDWTFVPYLIEGSGTVYISDASTSGKLYQRSDFERDLNKVTRG